MPERTQCTGWPSADSHCLHYPQVRTMHPQMSRHASGLGIGVWGIKAFRLANACINGIMLHAGGHLSAHVRLAMEDTETTASILSPHQAKRIPCCFQVD